MPFFPVDDDAAFHAKMRAAGNAAVGLWVRAGAYCMKEATGGVLQRHELEGLGKASEVRKLVEVVLWHAHGHDCDRCPQPPKGGWVFHDWLDWGPLKSAEQIKDRREADRERQRRKRDRDRHAVTPTVSNAERHGGRPRSPYPSPSPSVVQVVSQSPTTTRGVDGLTDEDLDKIRTRLGASSVTFARQVAGEILTRADTAVLRPLRYILAAIDAEPDRYRPTPGPVTKADECTTHPGQRASNCGGCRADRLAGDA
jgi:hypothetical protein